MARMWTDHSKCRWGKDGAPDPSFFFPDDGIGSAAAKAFCTGAYDGDPCPTIRECLVQALMLNEKSGVWGAQSQRERVKVRRRWLLTGEIRPETRVTVRIAKPQYENIIRRYL